MATYAAANDPTNPDAVPAYNDNILKFWNWFDTVWNCNDWMTWYKAMKSKYGKSQAQNTFLHYWNDLATGSSAIDCRSFNEDFRTYFSNEGMLDALYSGLGIIAMPIGTGTDVLTGIGSAVSGAAKGLGSVGNVLKVAIPVVLVGAIGIGGFWVYKNYIKKK